MTDRTSRLIDILLEQELSPEPAWIPDADILKKARSLRFKKAAVRLALTAAAAACILFFILFQNITATKDWSEPLPGSEISAVEKTEHIRMSKHITISVLAGSDIWIPEDMPNTIFVEKGTVQCSVDPGGAGFKVVSDAGEAEVTGTLFSVTVSNEPEPDAETALVTMNVSVDRGTVIVRGDQKEQTVSAGGRTQIRARVRKRTRQQKRLRGRGRSENSPERQPENSPGKKADTEQKSGQETKAETPDAAFIKEFDTYISGQVKTSGQDRISVCRSVMNSLEKDTGAGEHRQLQDRIAAHAEKTGILPEKARNILIARLKAYIADDEKKTDINRNKNRNTRTGKRNQRSGPKRNRRSKK